MKIIIENSTWNNVGDAFYQFPIYEIIKNTLTEHDVFMFDGPIYRAFKISSGNFFKKNALDIRKILEADIFVFSGPILGNNFIYHYAEVIKFIKDSGKNYMILSSFGDSKSHKENVEFLMKYPPLAFSSRTKKTFDIYSKVAKHSYNGVCNAFFISKVIPTLNLNLKDYLIFNFYSTPEPIIDFNIKENNIQLESIKIKEKKNYFNSVLRHLDFLRKHPIKLHSKKIIRTVHDISYKFLHLNFGRKNSYLSYNPLNYLPLYKNCELTISDRVHACVASLSFNKPAMLVGDWGERAELFQRFNIQKVNNVILPTLEQQINQEYIEYVNWIKNVFK